MCLFAFVCVSTCVCICEWLSFCAYGFLNEERLDEVYKTHFVHHSLSLIWLLHLIKKPCSLGNNLMFFLTCGLFVFPTLLEPYTSVCGEILENSYRTAFHIRHNTQSYNGIFRFFGMIIKKKHFIKFHHNYSKIECLFECKFEMYVNCMHFELY